MYAHAGRQAEAQQHEARVLQHGAAQSKAIRRTMQDAHNAAAEPAWLCALRVLHLHVATGFPAGLRVLVLRA